MTVPAVATEVDVQSAQGFVAVLRNRPFLRMWTSQAISQTAQNIINLALLADLPVAVALTGIYMLGFLFASVSQFFGPAEGAAIPFVVRRRDLAQANALFTLTITVSQLIGFATLGPVLVGILGLNRLYLV